MPSATTRLALPYPLNADAVDVPGDIQALATALDNVVPYSQGVVGSRPVSTGGSPGIQGRRYYATDEGIEYLDTGSSWIVSPRPAGSIAGTELANSAVTAGKLASDAVTTAKILNANVTDEKLASPSNGVYRDICHVQTCHTDTTGNSAIVVGPNGALVDDATAPEGIFMFYFDPANYAVAGKTTKIRTKLALATNGTASGISGITAYLQAVSSVAGGADTMAFTLGTAYAANTIAGDPGANALAHQEVDNITVLAAGYYTVRFTINTTLAANARMALNYTAQVYWV